MVDAITSYRVSNIKKDSTINWNTLTVKEIKEYEEEGQEVPEYIKTWYEYVEKLSNIPDDITYTTYVNSNSVSTSTNSVSTSTNSRTSPSTLTKAGVYQKLCQDTITNIKNVTEDLDEILKNAEKEVSEAESGKEGFCDRIQTLQEQSKKLSNDKNNPLAAMEQVDINNRIKTTADTGMASMELRLALVENIGDEITEAYDLVSGAISLATTVETSASEACRVGLYLVRDSKELKKIAKESKQDLKSAAETQEGNLSTVLDYKKSIAGSAGEYIAPGGETSNSNSGSINSSTDITNSSKSSSKTDEKNAQTKAKNTNSSKKSKEEKSKTLAYEKILTDPNEILKRKQKRGEV